MARDDDRVTRGILGDIRPSAMPHKGDNDGTPNEPDLESMVGGSQHDRTQHSGTRDVTEGTTGGTGTETGGTRNYRQGTGATGTDIGNRPE